MRATEDSNAKKLGLATKRHKNHKNRASCAFLWLEYAAMSPERMTQLMPGALLGPYKIEAPNGGIHSWQQARNDLSAVAAINTEVRIRGDHQWVGNGFGHAHETGIGEAHGNIAVFFHERCYRFDFISQIER